MFFSYLSCGETTFPKTAKDSHAEALHALLCQNDPLHGVQDVCRKYRIEFGMIWVALNFPGTTFPKDSKGQSCRRHALLPRMILCMECGIILFLADEHQRR